MSGWLKLHVVKGRNLRPMDANGFSDPFVSIHIDGHSAPMKTLEGKPTVTSSKKVTLNPVWNAEFKSLVWQRSGTLWFDVWDKDTFGEDSFMGRVEVELGVATAIGSSGEQWFKLQPRKGNGVDEREYAAAKGPKFGEIYVKWMWVYSHVGQLLTQTAVDGPEIDWTVKDDLDFGMLNKQIYRMSAWGYSLCLPWFWACEKFMWDKPFESIFVLYLINVVVYYDMLSELFFGTIVMLMLLRWRDRAMYGYYGPPQPPLKVYNDPFEWMRDTNTQLNYTQLLCAWYSDMFDYYFEILNFDRYDQAAALTKFLGAWTVLAYVGWFPPLRYVFLATVWYMFTLYPMMYTYPKGYKAVMAVLCDPVTGVKEGYRLLKSLLSGGGDDDAAGGPAPVAAATTTTTTTAAAAAAAPVKKTEKKEKKKAVAVVEKPPAAATGTATATAATAAAAPTGDAPAKDATAPAAAAVPLAPISAPSDPAKLEVCGSAAPYAGLPGPVRRVLEMNQAKGWAVSKQDKEMTYETMKFDYCPVNAVRVVGEMKTTSTEFAKFIVDEKNSKSYDELMKSVRVVEERPGGGKCLHAMFKSPSFVVSPRDMCTFSISSLLPDETVEHFGLVRDASIGSPADIQDFKGTPGVFASGGMSILHADVPDEKGYVRGCVHGFGWIYEPLTPATGRVTFILAMDPSGNIPQSVVNIANAAQINKWRSVKKMLKA